MKSLLIRCYPAAWRARYGDEFEAILDEGPLGPFDAADILLGALDARMRARSRPTANEHPWRFTMSQRVGGIAAIVSALVWGLSIIVGLNDLREPQLALMIVAAAALAIAVVGLGTFRTRVNVALAWTALVLPVVGASIALVGLVTTWLHLGAWDSLFTFGFVVAMAGSTVFGIAAYRSGDMSRAGAGLLILGTILVPVTYVVASVFWDLAVFVGIGALVAFPLGWFILGLEAVRKDRSSAALRPA